MTDMQAGPRTDCGAGEGHSRSPEACFKIRKGSLTHTQREANVVSTCRHSREADRTAGASGCTQACIRSMGLQTERPSEQV